MQDAEQLAEGHTGRTAERDARLKAVKAARRQALERHLGRLDRWIERLKALDRRFFWARLGTLLAGAIAVFLALPSEQARPLQIAILAFVAAFSLVVFLHRRVDRGARGFALSRPHPA